MKALRKGNHSDDLPIYLIPILEEAQGTSGSLWHSIMVSIMEIQGEDLEEKADLVTSQLTKYLNECIKQQ